MNTNQPVKRLAGASSRFQAWFVFAYYLITMLAGAFVLSFHGRFVLVGDFLVAVFYLTLTGFLYGLSRSVSNDRRPLRASFRSRAITQIISRPARFATK